MYRDYDTKDHCSAGGEGGMFAYYTLNACIVSDGDEGGSFLFGNCDNSNGIYTIVQFSDSHCTDFVSAVTTKLQVGLAYVCCDVCSCESGLIDSVTIES